MIKKSILQIFLLLIVIILGFFVYNKYFNNKKLNNSLKTTKVIESNKSALEANIIYNIEYSSYDNYGSKYIIKATRGKINNNNKNLILMEGVTATITPKDSLPINFKSNEAFYNNTNYNTEFYGDVLVTYIEHEIRSDNLDLDFNVNLANISGNVFYKNLNTSLKSDRISIDLLSKDTKIFMNDKLKKIKIININ
jgi:hypothetical protein